MSLAGGQLTLPFELGSIFCEAMGSLFFLIGGAHASAETCRIMGPLEQFFKVAARAWLFLVFLDIVVVVRNPYMPGR